MVQKGFFTSCKTIWKKSLLKKQRGFRLKNKIYLGYPMGYKKFSVRKKLAILPLMKKWHVKDDEGFWVVNFLFAIVKGCQPGIASLSGSNKKAIITTDS